MNVFNGRSSGAQITMINATDRSPLYGFVHIIKP